MASEGHTVTWRWRLPQEAASPLSPVPPNGAGPPDPRHTTFQALPRACELSSVSPSTCYQPGIRAAGSAGPWPPAAQPGHLNNQIPPIPAGHAGLIATCFSSSAALLGDLVSSSLYLTCPPPPPHSAEFHTASPPSPAADIRLLPTQLSSTPPPTTTPPGADIRLLQEVFLSHPTSSCLSCPLSEPTRPLPAPCTGHILWAAC